MKAAAVLLALLLTRTSAASDEACMVLVENQPPTRADIDGPGSFGPLHETMSIGCLDYVEFEKTSDGNRARLVDHTGRVHIIRPGEFVGENSGQVAEITRNRIAVVQVVRGASGEYAEVRRYLFRRDRDDDSE
ncbi:MAG: pilus assembly protein PilP [Xanthomonadales bacterium]|nr:pilus assembly protein PilP [Xanthomonadales bacterium]MBK7146219.1 pilus assembly protein PilP [Xanthomonadales bacterium]MCC6563190.1 pilus assembly protein PilP [Xanthomonadales bacterium]